MATTSNSYTGNGSTTNYSITFPYLDTADIKAQIDGVTTTAFSLANATTVQFSSAPGNGTDIIIYRQTSDEALAGGEFFSGSSIRAQTLNNNFNQTLYIGQETAGRALTTLGGTMIGDLSMATGAKVVFEGATDDAHETTLTVTDPTADRTISLPNVSGTVVTTGDTGTVSNGMLAGNSVDSSKIADGSIVNADINASAAIAGTKISPNFGSQNIVTSGTVDGRDVSTDGSKLDGIEAGATADQTNAEIRAAVEAASDSNVFTDADHTKLNGIEASATADQTVGEIKSLIAGSPLDSSHLAADSVTASEIAANAVGTSEIADAELVTLAGMQSGTASKLADSTALTADLADLNQLDGMGKETTITNDDAKFPTSGAVVDYVAAQIAPLGGLEVIATEVAFPNTQPSSGVVISISDAGGVVFNGSGSSTTGRTVGGSTVTINNAPSSLNGETLVAGVGLMVSSTGSGQIYNYHKILGKEDDIKQLSDDINDFNARYRVNAGEPGSSNDAGDLVFDTNANKMKVYDGSSWGEVASTGEFKFLFLCPAGGSGAPTINGSIATYDLRQGSNSGTAADVTIAAQLLVSVNGVVQKANSGTSAPSEGFAMVDANTIVFGTNLPSGADVFIIQIGSSVTVPTPGDDTVSSAKIQNGAVVEAKLSTGAVTQAKVGDQAINEAKLQVSNAPTNGYYLSAQSGNTGGLTWAAVEAGAKGGGSDDIFWENGQTVTTNYTITNNKNAMSAGPITINNGIAVTIGTGEYWTIV
jgi:hypothetical protein